MALTTMTSACAAPLAPPPGQGPKADIPSSWVRSASGVHVIIKMRDERLRLDDPSLRAQLARSSQARIELIRPMSGAAWVVGILPEPGNGIEAALARLRADPRVEFAEPDMVVRSHTAP
ncbi:MAG: hypothetical protein ING40_01595 [Burkholderiales bacterium]|nr:hypothetical protein [Burkholderiales bacterium]MCA3227723.1 hypothetical protein [Burkholderiales bacterium]